MYKNFFKKVVKSLFDNGSAEIEIVDNKLWLKDLEKRRKLDKKPPHVMKAEVDSYIALLGYYESAPKDSTTATWFEQKAWKEIYDEDNNLVDVMWPDIIYTGNRLYRRYEKEYYLEALKRYRNHD